MSDAPPQRWGRESEGTPLWPMCWAGKTQTERERSASVHPSTPRRSSGHFQRNFDTSNYGGLGSDRSIPGPSGRTEERRTDNRLRSRQRLGPSAVRVCLPPHPFSPGGLFKTSACASPCMFTHHYCPLSFPTLVSFLLRPLNKAAEGRAGWRRRERKGSVWSSVRGRRQRCRGGRQQENTRV